MSDDYSKKLAEHQRDVWAGRFGKPSAGNPYSISYQHGSELGGRDLRTGQLLNNSSTPALGSPSNPMPGTGPSVSVGPSGGIPPIIFVPLLLIGFILGFAALVGYVGSNIGGTRSGNFPDATNIPEQDLTLFSHTCTNAYYVRLETALRGDQKILAHIQAGTRFGLIESNPTSLPTGLRINDPVKVAVKKKGWSIFPTDHKYSGWSILPNSSDYINGYIDRRVVTACTAVPGFDEETALGDGNVRSRARHK